MSLFKRTLSGLADRRSFLEQPVVAGLPAMGLQSAAHDFYFFPSYPVTDVPPALQRRDGWVYYTPYTFPNYFVDLQRLDSFEAYLATFSGKTRSTLRRKVKRFAEASGGEIQWRALRRTEEMDEFLRLAVPLSERTYQARLLDAGLPASPEFASELRRRAGEGEVRAYLLLLDGKAAAYVLCFCRRGIATYDYVGFDPDLHALSPGTVLQYLLLEAMFAERDLAIFDFTEGEGAQKQLFATDHLQCAKTYVLRASLVNILSLRLHGFLNAASTGLGQILDRWGLKDRVRKMLRSKG
jgi:CelD/BcsL family acetyltransferase involved in cellulose biosynthesis